jgi:hypothetical protein
MGSWGSGMFDNDTASDYVIKLTERLCTEIDCDLATIDDGLLEREFGATIGVLRLLAESVHGVKVAISKSTVRRWQSILDDWFKAVIESEQRDCQHWSEYRDNVMAEIIKLERAAAAQDV